MHTHPEQAGFTLVELVLVIVIIGILAVVAAPRFFTTQGFTQRGYFDELQTAVRYAQKLAVATQCPVQVTINTSGYALFMPNDTDANPATCDMPAVYGSNPVRRPAGSGNFASSTPNGVNVTSSFTSTVFDALGQPSVAGSVDVGGNTFSLETVTGYVH